MKTFVKICGITNEADALLAVGLGADSVGLIFAPSSRQVSLATAGDIVRRLPPETLVVGVFRDEAPLRVVEIANQLGFGGVQLHGNESVADVQYISERVPLVIKALAATRADLLLIDGPNPGSGEVFDWSLAEGVAHADQLIVSGGLTPQNVASALGQIHPYGVDVATGVEMAPGVKDPRKLKAFVDAVRDYDEDREVPEYGDVDDGPFDWSRS